MSYSLGYEISSIYMTTVEDQRDKALTELFFNVIVPDIHNSKPNNAFDLFRRWIVSEERCIILIKSTHNSILYVTFRGRYTQFCYRVTKSEMTVLSFDILKYCIDSPIVTSSVIEVIESYIRMEEL